MAANQRIKGQEVSVVITTGGELEAELTDVKQCEFAIQLEMKEEGYLGEKTNRFDDQYNGIHGSLTIHMHSKDPINFMTAIKERAQRTVPDRVFAISGIFSFPSGETCAVSVDDVFFGPIPLSTNDRGDYVEAKFEWGAGDYDTPDV